MTLESDVDRRRILTSAAVAALVRLDEWPRVAGELMELHTLGVDGGYTHADIDEVARCFTGWSVDRRSRPGTFRFYPQFHDYGAKEVLGVKIAARGGLADGEKVLELLASHPSTAHHVAEKLCRRFLADEPPASAVESAAATFSATDGDLREVVRTILTSPEMEEVAGAKRKRPFELLVSALRALDVPLGAEAVRPLVVALRRLGQSPFDWPAPDGYPDTADDWATVGGTLGGWNLGLAPTLGAVSLATHLPRLVFAAAGSAVLERFQASLAALYTGDDAFSALGRQTLDAIELLDTAVLDDESKNGASYPESELGSALSQVATLIRAEIGLEAACVDAGGWDTYDAQGTTEGRLPGLLLDLGSALHAFATDLADRLDQLTVVVMTEFGRRVDENASAGTDHGRGSCMWLLGGDVFPGFSPPPYLGLFRQS